MIVDYKDLINRLKNETYWLGSGEPYSHDVHPVICDEAVKAIEELLERAEKAEKESEEYKELFFAYKHVCGGIDPKRIGELVEADKAWRWIPCSEKMPEEGLPEGRVQVTVAACTDAGEKIIASRVFKPEKKFIYEGIEEVYPAHWSWSRETYSEITCWMPLPETQKKEQNHA